MWQQILEIAAANGIWAVMFLGLLVYQLKDSRAREEKYQEVISSLADDLGELKLLRQDVEKIGENLTDYLFETDKGAEEPVHREE